MEDEIFGPILPILTYKDMDAAIREVKRHPKPLSGFLFSRDQKATITASQACPSAAARSIR